MGIVLTAAALVLEADGYGGATTEKVARRAGVSIGTIYQYFRNKDDIFHQLLDREAERFLSRLRAFEIDDRATFSSNLANFLLRDGLSPDLSPDLYRELSRVPDAGLKLRNLADGVVDAVAGFIKRFRTDVSEERLRVMAQLVTMTAQGMSQLGSRHDFDNRLLPEYQVMIEHYLMSDCR